VFWDKSRKIEWVSNRLVISGEKRDLNRLRRKMGKAFTAPYTYNVRRDSFKFKPKHYSKPIFAFWNLGMFSANDWLFVTDAGIWEGHAWDSWNLAHWGVSLDVAVADDEINPTTSLEIASENVLVYQFKTGHLENHPLRQVPTYAIAELSSQFPSLDIELIYKREKWSEDECSLKFS
jgi:hypothetical protein